MGYYDYLMKAQEKVKQVLFDENIRMLGREVYAIRISANEDMFHDLTDVHAIYDDDRQISIIINFPDEIPVDRYRYSETASNVSETRISFIDLLPIVGYTKLDDNLEKNDLIFFSLNDEKKNSIPFILQVCEVFGKFEKSMVWKKVNLAPYHGAISREVYQLMRQSYYYYQNLDGKVVASPLVSEQPTSTRIEKTSRTEEFLGGGW